MFIGSTPQHLRAARIFVVDDEPENLETLRTILMLAGYADITTIADPRELLDGGIRAADLMLLDLQMPYLDGFDVLDLIQRQRDPNEFFPIIVLTGNRSREARERALSNGASDFITKPFDTTEIVLRVRNLLERRMLHRRIREHSDLLELRVRERTRDLEDAELEILERLARAAEFRDDDTGNHTRRVGRVATLVAEALGCSHEQIDLIRFGAPLHDIGKIGVSDAILLKRDRLVLEEIALVRMHPAIGAQILSGSRFSILRAAEEIALTHHERWDGSGYPNGLASEEIPISGRIVAAVDAFDAITNHRPYRDARSISEALDELRQGSGTQFDPAVVNALTGLIEADVVPSSLRADHGDAPALPRQHRLRL